MRILFVSHYAGSYGANRSLVDLAKEIQSRGHDVLVVVPRQGRIEAKLGKAGVPYRILYHRLWVVEREANHVFLRGLVSRIANVIAEARLFLLARSWKPDLIHINFSCTPVGYHSSRWLGIPLVWHIREYLEEDYDLRFMNAQKAIREFRRADRVIAVSKDVARKYQELIGDNLGVIYNGVELPKPQVRNILTETRLELLLVGALVPGKRHADAIRAVYLAQREFGLEVRLRIVGNGLEPYVRSLRALVSEFELGDRVEFMGYLEDASALRSEVDIGLVCSTREAFGRVTVEAMASGMLVVASGNGGTCEIVRHQRTGLLYESGKPLDLASTLAWVAENRPVARAIAENGRKHCVKAFNLDRVADEVLGIYSECMESHGIVPAPCGTDLRPKERSGSPLEP